MRLLCTVRGCGEVLVEENRRAVCANGHSFDRARGGWLNLLQPQDKRSKTPGDSKEAVEARRRLLEAGTGASLLEMLIAAIGTARGAMLDVGCGEGAFLAGLSERFSLEAWGVDLSTPAIELAAKRQPALHLVIANADRALPFGGGSFELLTSVNARIHATEMHRVLAPGGRLAIVIPGEDDLRELREAVLGEARPLARLDAPFAALEKAGFARLDECESRATMTFSPAMLADALASTYRGQRRSQTPPEKPLPVTLHSRLWLGAVA